MFWNPNECHRFYQVLSRTDRQDHRKKKTEWRVTNSRICSQIKLNAKKQKCKMSYSHVPFLMLLQWMIDYQIVKNFSLNYLLTEKALRKKLIQMSVCNAWRIIDFRANSILIGYCTLHICEYVQLSNFIARVSHMHDIGQLK